MHPVVANQNVALVLGVAAVVAGAWLLHDAYEARGASRPFLLKFLPSA